MRVQMALQGLCRIIVMGNVNSQQHLKLNNAANVHWWDLLAANESKNPENL